MLPECGVGGGLLSLQGNILYAYYSFSKTAMRATCAQRRVRDGRKHTPHHQSDRRILDADPFRYQMAKRWGERCQDAGRGKGLWRKRGFNAKVSPFPSLIRSENACRQRTRNIRARRTPRECTRMDTLLHLMDKVTLIAQSAMSCAIP